METPLNSPIQRILLCGEVNGKYRLLLRALRQVQQRQGPFTALICCGRFFPSHTATSSRCSNFSQSCGNVKVETENNSRIEYHASKSGSNSDENKCAEPSAEGSEGSGTDVAVVAEPTSSRANENGHYLSDLLKQMYPEAFKELKEISEDLPFPLYFVDENISSLFAAVFSAASPSLQFPNGVSATEAAAPNYVAEVVVEPTGSNGASRQPSTLLTDSTCSAANDCSSSSKDDHIVASTHRNESTSEHSSYSRSNSSSSGDRGLFSSSTNICSSGRRLSSGSSSESIGKSNVERNWNVSTARSDPDVSAGTTSMFSACEGPVTGATFEEATTASEKICGSSETTVEGPHQLCTNVYWLGRAGFARIGELNVAFTAVPLEEEQQQSQQQQLCESSVFKRRKVEESAAVFTATERCLASTTGEQLSAKSAEATPGVAAMFGAADAATAASSGSELEWQQLEKEAIARDWCGRVDLLASSRWPAHVLQQLLPLEQHQQRLQQHLGSSVSEGSAGAQEELAATKSFQQLLETVGVERSKLESTSSTVAARLAALVEPRYLFAAAGFFYQRPPFRGAVYGYVSRFVSLGVLGSKSAAAKPLHALQVTPLNTLLLPLSQVSLPGSTLPVPCSIQFKSSNDSRARRYNISSSSDHMNQSKDSANSADFVEEAAATMNADTQYQKQVKAALGVLSALPAHSTASPFAQYVPDTLQAVAKAKRQADAVAAATAAATALSYTQNVSMPPSFDSAIPAASFPRVRQERSHQRPCCVVCVCNLPYNVDDHSLQKVMSAFGEVKFVYAPRNSDNTSLGTGRAFVVFHEPESAEKAVAASGQLEAGRRVLRVALWRERIPFAHKMQKGQNEQQRTNKSEGISNCLSITTEPHAACWFCLANPNVEKHLVAAVGDFCYVASPKGGMHPLHSLIVPITHFPSVAFAPPNVREEIGQQVHALRSALRKKHGLFCIVYERYIPMRTTKAMHTQVQCVPCTTAEGLRAAELFKKKAKEAGFYLEPLKHDNTAVAFSELPLRVTGTQKAYFYAELPGLCTASGQQVDRFLYVQHGQKNANSECSNSRYERGSNNGRVPMNFGREVIADLLERPELADWQHCVVEQEEEESRTKKLSELLRM